MYKIGIANYGYDADGNAMMMPADVKLFDGQRRATRTKTLDGGVVITDGGFAHGDRTLEIAIDYTEALNGVLWALFQNAGQVVVTTNDGAYLATFRMMTVSEGKINLTIWVKQILSG